MLKSWYQLKVQKFFELNEYPSFDIKFCFQSFRKHFGEYIVFFFVDKKVLQNLTNLILKLWRSVMFSDLEINGGEDYVPYVSQDPLNDPKSFIFRIKVFIHQNIFEILFCLFSRFFFSFFLNHHWHVQDWYQS